MKNRILYAAILIPLTYILLWIPAARALPFAIAVAIVSTIALHEFYAMHRHMRPYVPAGMLAVAVTPILVWKAFEPAVFAAFVMLIPLVVIFASLSARRQDPSASVMVTMAGVAYIAPAAGLLVALRGTPSGFGLVLLMLVGVWANDAGAYFVGRVVGRTKLAPRISPNKTLEGFLGGLVLGTFVVWYGHFLDQVDGSYWINGFDALIIGLAVALATPVGDLFESLLKRAADVKDSGGLLGEHGGMLDRIDSILLATPVMYLACYFRGVI
jgi:phosphatidate cytidylyltransferase